MKRKMKIAELVSKHRVGIWTDKAEKLEAKLFRAYDKDLMLIFLPANGTVTPLGRWSIWTRDGNGFAYCVYVCVDKETGMYREPSGQDVRHIVKLDRMKGAMVSKLLQEIDDSNDLLTRQRKKKLMDEIHDFSMSCWRQVAQVPYFRTGVTFGGNGKATLDVVKPKKILRRM